MIDLSRYRFSGEWDSWRMYLRAFAKSCEVKEISPSIVSHRDAIYVPTTTRRKGDQFLYSGAILNADGQPIKHGVLSRGGVPVSHSEPVEPTASGGSALYLGWLFPMYGHFLLETLARMWAVDRVSCESLLFHQYDPRRLESYDRVLLNEAGVDATRLLVPKQPTRFDVIQVAEPVFEVRRSAHRVVTQIYDKIRGDAKPDTRPVFISRTHLVKAKRTVIGEEVLEAILEENGFRIIHPQEMSREEQASAFRSHKTYVGLIGSAMHNLLFARQKPRIIYLTPDLPNFTYMLCDELVDAQSVYVYCCAIAGGRKSGITRLDLAAALSTLEAEGLARSRDVAIEQARIDREFELTVESTRKS